MKKRGKLKDMKKKAGLFSDYMGWFLIAVITAVVVIAIIAYNFKPSLGNIFEYIKDLARFK